MSDKSGWGGARPGAGRPSSGRTPRLRVSIDLTPEERAAVWGLAAGEGITPSRWLKMAVQSVLREKIGSAGSGSAIR